MGILKYFEKYTLLIVKMFNSSRLIRRGPTANYVSSMHLADPSDCLNLTPSFASSHLHCNVTCSNISQFKLYIMHAYIAVMKMLLNM